MKQLALSLKFPGNETINTPVGFDSNITTLGSLVSKIVPYVFVFSAIGLLFMLIIGGFSLLTGSSDPKKIEGGKQKITYAIVGFIIVFLAYWFVQLAALIFGLKEFKGMFGL